MPCWPAMAAPQKSDLHKTLLTMGMADGAAYLIREYDLPLKMEDYNDVMWDVITKLYESVELKPGVRELLARLKAEGARMCICSQHLERPVPHRAHPFGHR